MSGILEDTSTDPLEPLTEEQFYGFLKASFRFGVPVVPIHYISPEDARRLAEDVD